MYIINVMAVTAAKPKKVEFDQDSKIQALWKRVCQIMLSKKESQLKVSAQSMYSHLTFPDFWLSFLTAEVRF